MKHLRKFNESDGSDKRQDRLRTLEDISLELSDDNFIVEVEVLSRDDKYISVTIKNRGFDLFSFHSNQAYFQESRFNYNKIKDTLLSMISYMESEGYSIKSIQVSDVLANLITVELKGEELYLKYRPEQMVDYPIGQLIIIFKE
jgi:hypothetical protein